MSFPKEFLWGCATSAGQVEGAAFEDGRSASIWDEFATKPGKIYNGETPTVACDSYHRFDRDLKNLKDLGVNAYRMSISWSRVMPQGVGACNQKGMDYYRRCFEQLQNAGITPAVTLYHWDLPQALEEKGGWVNRDSIAWFGEYAEKMFAAFSDVVPIWATINEPIATYVGYGQGGFAPGYVNEKWGNQARHNILVAHGKGVQAFRAVANKSAQVGVVIDIWKRHALTDTPQDRAMELDQDERNWKFYVDPILTGHYSDYILKKLAQEGTLMHMEEQDFALTSQPLDFFGLNVYNRVNVSADQKVMADFSKGGNFLGNNTEYYPQALYDAVKMLHDRYQIQIPIIITENGTYEIGAEPVGASGMIEDEDRIRYISGFLSELERAVRDGYDIRGYFLWSLMDNFEWTGGSNYKFGIMSTDPKTQDTAWKKSAYFYRDYIAGAKS